MIMSAQTCDDIM